MLNVNFVVAVLFAESTAAVNRYSVLAVRTSITSSIESRVGDKGKPARCCPRNRIINPGGRRESVSDLRGGAADIFFSALRNPRVNVERIVADFRLSVALCASREWIISLKLEISSVSRFISASRNRHCCRKRFHRAQRR